MVTKTISLKVEYFKDRDGMPLCSTYEDKCVFLTMVDEKYFCNYSAKETSNTPNQDCIVHHDIKNFIVYWLDGTSSEMKGYSIEDALTKAGYGNGTVRAVDYYDEC